MRELKTSRGFSGNGRATSVLIAILVVLAGLAHSAMAADSVTLSQANLGNIFTNSTETVQIPLTTTGTQVSWTCTDFYGAVTNGGPINVTSGAATIQPNLGRLGYFALHVTALKNGSAVATADTFFAVVAPVNVATMSDSPFGICTHFAEGWNTDVLPLLAKGGMAQYRDEQYWQTVEPTLTTPPTYNFSSFTPYTSQATALGLNLLAECDFENSNYDGGYTPYTDTGNAGFANYCAALLKKYTTTANGVSTPQVRAMEIWNEYNGSYANGTAASNRPVYYTAMLKAAYNAIKAQQPDVNGQPVVKIIGGASVPVPIPWFEDLFSAGALPYMDAADIHPYVDPPEGLETKLVGLQTAMANAPNGVVKPIWVTECGFTDDAFTPGRQHMASYLVRLMTVMRSTGVERAYWYLLYDADGYYSGLLRSPYDPMGKYVPSAGYSAYANLIQQLYGATPQGRVGGTDSRTRLYLFTRGTANTQVRVLWSTSGTAQTILSTTSPLTLVNIMGETTTLQPTNGQVAVSADINPVYVIGPVTAVREVGRDTLAADSIRDFGGTQGSGQGTWMYGYDKSGATVAGSTYVPGNFQPMTWARTDSGYAWTAPFYAAVVDQTGQHPSSYPNSDKSVYYQLWVVRRWQSNITGTAHITGHVSLNNTQYGDGANALIYVDGKQVYSTSLQPFQGMDFDFTTSVQAGSYVDFVGNPGPETKIDYDYLLFRAQIAFPVTPPTTYTAWQNQRFTQSEIINGTITGDNASPAGDGVPNLLKYAENLDPKVPNIKAFPTTGVTTSGGSKYLTLSFRQATTATDLTFTPQANDGTLTPSSWSAITTSPISSVDNGDGTRTVTYQDNVPISGTAPRRFMRLRVTRSQ